MGLDLYVGPLTRYHLGDWLTIVQQAGRDSGMPVETIRTSPEPEDKITDPAVVLDAVLAWRGGVATAANVTANWPEAADLPYWTDKPDWDGYGALVLLAAYDERPELRPRPRKGLLKRGATGDDPRQFAEAKAFKAAQSDPARYPSLLTGVEWWLPVAGGPTVFQAPRPTGQPTAISRIDQLMDELVGLNERTIKNAPSEQATVRKNGPPDPGASVEAVAAFGLSVFLPLCEQAVVHRQPLIMDY